MQALRRAGVALGLTEAQLARAVGLSTPDWEGLAAGQRLNPASQAGKRATQLIRCYLALGSLVGGSREAVRQWLGTRNRHLGGVPADVLMEPDGLDRMADYLDGLRLHG